MALLFMESVAHIDTTSITQKWGAKGANMTVSGGAFTAAASDAASTYLTSPALSPGSQTGYIGFRNKRLDSIPLGGFSVWIAMAVVDATGTPLITVTHDADTIPSIRRGDYTGTVLASGSSPMYTNGVRTYIELGFTIDGTNGSAELRSDNVPLVTITGVNTNPAGNWSAFTLYPGSAIDIYALDSTGSRLNFFLGKDTSVVALFPSGVGTYSQFSSTGGIDYSCVDEAAPNGNTDYVTGQLAGTKDSYAMGNLGSTYNAVHAVQACESVETIAADKTIRPGLVIGSGWYPGTTRAADFAYRIERYIWERNPATGAIWTESVIDSAELGMEVVS